MFSTNVWASTCGGAISLPKIGVPLELDLQGKNPQVPEQAARLDYTPLTMSINVRYKRVPSKINYSSLRICLTRNLVPAILRCEGRSQCPNPRLTGWRYPCLLSASGLYGGGPLGIWLFISSKNSGRGPQNPSVPTGHGVRIKICNNHFWRIR